MLRVLYTVFLQVQKQVPEKITRKTHLQYHTVFAKKKKNPHIGRFAQFKLKLFKDPLYFLPV